MVHGRVEWYSNAIGYGFVLPSDGGERVFLHRTGIASGGGEPFENGAQVTYEPSRGREGMEARNVVLDLDALAAREVREKVAGGFSVEELESHEKRHENRAVVVAEYDHREREINGERIKRLLLDRLRAKE